MTAKKKPKPPEPTGPAWLKNPAVINGLKWLPGKGNLPADYMVVGEKPGVDDMRIDELFSGGVGDKLLSVCAQAGFDTNQAYFTNIVKYIPAGNKAISAKDIRFCKPYFDNEVKRCNPKVIVCMGAKPLKAILGNKVALKDVQSAFVPHPDLPGVEVYAMYNPGYILRNPEVESEYVRQWRTLAARQHGKSVKTVDTNYMLINRAEGIKAFHKYLLENHVDNGLAHVCVDCEWHGITWMHKDRYIRTVQLGYEIGKAVIVEFYGRGTVPEGKEWTPDCKESKMDDHDKAWGYLRDLLTDPKVGISGHNVIADGEWLLSYGVDIRNNVVYDTMLAEHTLNATGPFSLTDLTCKYTDMGKYDLKLVQWVHEHPKETIHGYGAVPDELLYPYAAKDVDAPLRIMQEQMPRMQEFMQPRGEYPSLWSIVMYTQRMIYEMEITGMPVDPERIELIKKAYMEKLQELLSKLHIMVAQPGIDMPNFNHRSTPQVRELLFDRLGLTPVKTTDNKPWRDVMSQPSELQKITATPSTDANTLSILQDKHPIAGRLSNVRKVDTIVKNFFKEDPNANPSTKGGGIKSKIWPDGKIHAHFSQLAETGRFRHSKPNVANWPKRAEGALSVIFGGKDKAPPNLRTIVIPSHTGYLTFDSDGKVVPSKGCLLVEADFSQAELFVLASLSQDVNMLQALNTPGKDMHDMTAISAFKLQLFYADDTPVIEQDLLDLAAKDMDAFEKLQKTLIYVDQKGRRMTRAEMKGSIRISAKNLNFGIPWNLHAELKPCELLGHPTWAISSQALNREGSETSQYGVGPNGLLGSKCKEPAEQVMIWSDLHGNMQK